MTSMVRLVVFVAGLVLLMHVTPSWGQPTCQSPGCNPTVTDGNFNTAGGSGALANLVSGPSGGVSNAAFGFYALYKNTIGNFNTASGDAALLSNTTGTRNTASGVDALFSNTTGGYNTATGVGALLANTTGNFNTASGGVALRQNTTGELNTASGYKALYENTGGTSNAAFGAEALWSNTIGSNNTACGFQGLLYNEVGRDNTSSGFQALYYNTGSRNTAVGSEALSQCRVGGENIAIGFQAGAALTEGAYNIYLGNPGGSSESFTMRLGTAQKSTFVAGINTAGVSGTAVMVDANGQLGVTLSSARYKQDIAPMGSQSHKVLDLRPVTFSYKDDARATTHYGLLAEEVATVYPDLVTRTASGEAQTVKYQELIPMLLNELQRQQKELAEIVVLRKELAELRALVGQGRGKVVLSSTGE